MVRKAFYLCGSSKEYLPEQVIDPYCPCSGEQHAYTRTVVFNAVRCVDEKNNIRTAETPLTLPFSPGKSNKISEMMTEL